MEQGVRNRLPAPCSVLHAPRFRLGITMSTGSKKKRRIDRVTSVELPPGVWGNLWGHLRRGHVLGAAGAVCAGRAAAVGDHAGLGAAAAVSLGRCAAARHRGPHRSSSEKIEKATAKAREQARSLAIAIYDQDPAAARAASREAGKRSHRAAGGRNRCAEVDAIVGAVPPAAGRRHAASRPRKSASSSSSVPRGTCGRRGARRVQDVAQRVARAA